MDKKPTQLNWEEYCQAELNTLRPILKKLGFILAGDQVHLSGERYLISPEKLVLLGTTQTERQRVIIKVSNSKIGVAEIERERRNRRLLQNINFSYHVFLSPKEILFTKSDNYTIFITAFIEQVCSFLERPLAEQFFLSLKVFSAQEGAHASTYEHAGLIGKTFGRWSAKNYLDTFIDYQKQINILVSDKTLTATINQAASLLQKNAAIIDLYGDFLVHWDLVPHNIRVSDHDIYLLDHSSLHFGNKYEGWARFINFMTLYNRPLEKMLLDYVRQNRNEREYLSLQLMRVFRLADIIKHYASLIPRLTGNLELLNKKRLDFWTSALQSVLADEYLATEIVETYKKERDALRSSEEKLRQKELH